MAIVSAVQSQQLSDHERFSRALQENDCVAASQTMEGANATAALEWCRGERAATWDESSATPPRVIRDETDYFQLWRAVGAGRANAFAALSGEVEITNSRAKREFGGRLWSEAALDRSRGLPTSWIRKRAAKCGRHGWIHQDVNFTRWCMTLGSETSCDAHTPPPPGRTCQELLDAPPVEDLRSSSTFPAFGD